MSPNQAFFAGLFIALAVVTTFYLTTPRPASALSSGPYVISRHSNPTANAGVFRLDTASGGLSYCYITSQSELVCSHEVK